MYRIVKYGQWLWVIIEPDRQLFLRNPENNNLLTFKRKLDAINYCNKMGYKIMDEYL